MSERSLNRLFLRYRSKGDANALGELFDRVAPELLKLSMHLVRDPGEAEDVLQATFLAAIEGADSFDSSRPLLPWLTGILARQAGLVRRRARRVIEPDRLTERESVDPAESAALREFSEELVLALQALPDNYREVLWLHLADGKRPVEIAQDLNRAPGTVRMQVHRGLDLLRRALPAGYAAGAGILGATRGLAAVRGEVLAGAATRWRPAPPASSAPHAPGSIAGAIGASPAALQASIAVLLVAALAGGLWWQQRAARVERAEVAGAQSSTRSESDRATTPDSSNLRRGIVGAGTGAAPTQIAGAVQTAILMRGHVRGCSAEELSDVSLRVSGVARFALPAELEVHGRPALDGSFELDVSRLLQAAKPKRPIEELVLEADHPRYAREVLHIPVLGPPDSGVGASETDSNYSADIDLSAAGRVTGRALMPSSRSAAVNGAATDAIVALYALTRQTPMDTPVDRGVVSADGTFALRSRVAGEHVLLLLAEGMRPSTTAVSLAPGLTVPLGPIVLDEGALIEGQALQLGVPMGAGALVSVASISTSAGFALEGSRLSWTASAFERAGRIVETDSDGRFRIGGLAPGSYQVGVARAAPEGALDSQRRLLLSTAAWTSIDAPARDVVINASFATVHLQVRAANASDTAASKPAHIQWSQGFSRCKFSLALDAQSSVSVEPGVTCEVQVEAEGFLGQTITFDAPQAGSVSTQTVLLAKDPGLAELSVEIRRPRDVGGAAWTEATFQFTSDKPLGGETVPFVRHADSNDGMFRLSELPAGIWTVRVFAGGVYEHYRDCWCEAKFQVLLSAANPVSTVVTLERGGQLQIGALNSAGSFVAAQCTLSPPGGEALDVEFVGRGPLRSIVDSHVLSPLGSCDVRPNLRAGTYEINVMAKGYEPARLEVEIVPGARVKARALLLESKPPR